MNQPISGNGVWGANGQGAGEKRLLVCDDEPAFGRLVKTVAEELGYTVKVTADGQEFIDAYEAFEPTTILLDMVMPRMDGNEVVLWLAAQRCSARLIIITGFAPDYAAHAGVLAEFKGLGPVTTLRKPINVKDLRAVLSE